MNRVMIRVPNWVGDAVMAVPALRELRRIFTGRSLTLVARQSVAGLFDGEGLADNVIPVNNARGFMQHARSFLRDVRTLRQANFDMAVLLQNAFGAALMVRAAGVGTIVGYPTDGRRALLDLVVPVQPNYQITHQVFYYLSIASHLESRLTGESRVETAAAEPQLTVGPLERERASQVLQAVGINTSMHRILAINPGATNSRAKRWLAERFAQTADRLAERDGFQVIIVGAQNDVEAAAETASHMRSPVAILAGKTSISELKALLSCTSLVVSNDTGAAHVAAALGIPTVVVFGPTEHFLTRPYSARTAVVRHDVECSPCMLRDCPIDHRCMTRVEADNVYRAAHSLLAH